MAIKKYTDAIESETPARYIEEFYVDAITDKGGAVKVIDSRRTRTVTVAQIESERDNYQAQADLAQGKLDEITAINTVEEE